MSEHIKPQLHTNSEDGKHTRHIILDLFMLSLEDVKGHYQQCFTCQWEQL